MTGRDVRAAREVEPSLAVQTHDVLTAEWTKLRSVRSTHWTLLVASVFAVGGSAITAYPDAHGGTPFDPLVSIFLAWPEYPLLAIGILGVLAFTAEYSTGQIRTTFSSVPQRLAVLIAKASVTGIVVLCLGEVLSFTSFFVSEAILSGHHASLAVSHPGVLGALLAAGFSLSAIALLGVGLGVIFRNTAGAVAALLALIYLPLVVLFLAPPWNDQIARFTLLMAAYQLVSLHPRPDLLSPLLSLVVLVAWPAAVLFFAGFLINRRDA